jgi:hypothetical protein
MSLVSVSEPRGVFPGQNFITPNILGYFRGEVGNRIAYVELSEGRGMAGEPIFGVTVRRPNGANLDPNLSKLMHSRAAAMAYIEDIFGGAS